MGDAGYAHTLLFDFMGDNPLNQSARFPFIMEHVYEEKDHIRLSRCLFFSFYRGSHICRDHSDPAEGNAGKSICEADESGSREAA